MFASWLPAVSHFHSVNLGNARLLLETVLKVISGCEYEIPVPVVVPAPAAFSTTNPQHGKFYFGRNDDIFETNERIRLFHSFQPCILSFFLRSFHPLVVGSFTRPLIRPFMCSSFFRSFVRPFGRPTVTRSNGLNTYCGCRSSERENPREK